MADPRTIPVQGVKALERRAVAFNTALTSLRKKRKELGGGFSEVTVEWVDMCGQKVTERFGEEHHAKKKKTVGACIINPVPNNRPATAIDILKTASFGACHTLACDLGGKDAVYELCRAWMKDADIKSNFAQSLVWHYYKHTNELERNKIKAGTTAQELFDTFASYKAFLLKAKTTLHELQPPSDHHTSEAPSSSSK